jgi:hypothetical protein
MQHALLEEGEKERSSTTLAPSNFSAAARKLVEALDAAKLRRWGVLLGLVFGWYFFSVTFNAYLKSVLKAAPCPHLAGLACFGLSTLLSLLTWALKIYPWPSLPPGRLHDVLSSALPHVAVRCLSLSRQSFLSYLSVLTLFGRERC